MVKKISTQHSGHSQHFLTGFLIGGVISSIGAYMLLTTSGRKLSKIFLQLAENLGEKGDEYLESIPEVSSFIEAKKQEAENTIGRMINKLENLPVGEEKKSIDKKS